VTNNTKKSAYEKTLLAYQKEKQRLDVSVERTQGQLRQNTLAQEELAAILTKSSITDDDLRHGGCDLRDILAKQNEEQRVFSSLTYSFEEESSRLQKELRNLKLQQDETTKHFTRKLKPLDNNERGKSDPH
jgi:hypothetical protein